MKVEQREPGGGGDSQLSNRKKQPYEKPTLRTIGLVTEEVLSVGCKLQNGPGGPIGATCTSASCFSPGS